MKICVRNSDNLVMFIGENLQYSKDENSLIISGDVTCMDLTSSNSKILPIDILPNNFISGGFTYQNGLFAITPQGQAIIDRNKATDDAKRAEETSRELISQANTLITESDITAIRCIENDVKLPETWKQYRKDLRAVIKGTSTTIPTRPEYPAGT